MRTLAVLALLTCVACDGPTGADAGVDGGSFDGGSIDSGADAGSADASLDGGVLAGDLERDFCAPLAAAVCESAGACGCGGVLPGGTLDPDACEASYVARCMESFRFVADAVASGAARIRRDAALACIERVRSETPECTRPSGVTVWARCEPFFTGLEDLGEPCAVAVCADGAGTCRGGTCVARRGSGEACESPFDCATGLICADAMCRAPAAAGEACSEALPCGPPLRCVDGMCAELLAQGAACTSTSECNAGASCATTCDERESASCSTDDDCGNLAVCAPLRACGARLSEGESCDRDALCAEGLFCDDALHQCTPLPGLDEPCIHGVLCAAGLGCDELAGSVCRAPGGEGAPCLAGPAGPSVCAGDLGCYETDAGLACAPIVGTEGTPCTIDARCAAGFACSFEAEGSICRAIRGEGEPCITERVCDDDLFCDFASGTCLAVHAAGEPCESDFECAGVCVLGSGGGRVCADRPGDGEPCTFDDHCAPERACVVAERGVCADEVCREVL